MDDGVDLYVGGTGCTLARLYMARGVFFAGGVIWEVGEQGRGVGGSRERERKV
jgi:hypothetical protein